MDPRELAGLQETHDRLVREAERAGGRHEAALKRLREEYGVETLEEAEAKLKELEAEAARLEGEAREGYAAWEKEWKDKLGDL